MKVYRGAKKSDFDVALERAHVGDVHPRTGKPYPQPLCADRPAEFVDYELRPSAREAMALCGPCPLFDLCAADARRKRPAWGIRAGVVWVRGRRAHTLADFEDTP